MSLRTFRIFAAVFYGVTFCGAQAGAQAKPKPPAASAMRAVDCTADAPEIRKREQKSAVKKIDKMYVLAGQPAPLKVDAVDICSESTNPDVVAVVGEVRLATGGRTVQPSLSWKPGQKKIALAAPVRDNLVTKLLATGKKIGVAAQQQQQQQSPPPPAVTSRLYSPLTLAFAGDQVTSNVFVADLLTRVSRNSVPVHRPPPAVRDLLALAKTAALIDMNDIESTNLLDMAGDVFEGWARPVIRQMLKEIWDGAKNGDIDEAKVQSVLGISKQMLLLNPGTTDSETFESVGASYEEAAKVKYSKLPCPPAKVQVIELLEWERKGLILLATEWDRYYSPFLQAEEEYLREEAQGAEGAYRGQLAKEALLVDLNDLAGEISSGKVRASCPWNGTIDISKTRKMDKNERKPYPSGQGSHEETTTEDDKVDISIDVAARSAHGRVTGSGDFKLVDIGTHPTCGGTMSTHTENSTHTDYEGSDTVGVKFKRQPNDSLQILLVLPKYRTKGSITESYDNKAPAECGLTGSDKTTRPADPAEMPSEKLAFAVHVDQPSTPASGSATSTGTVTTKGKVADGIDGTQTIKWNLTRARPQRRK